MTTTGKTLSELARLVGGRVVGDEGGEITGVASIEEAGPADISLIAHPRYRSRLAGCRAGAIIMGDQADPPKPPPGKALLLVPSPYVAFAKIVALFHPPPRYEGGISPQASIDPTASVAEGAKIFPFVYLAKGVKVGRGTVLFPGVFLGEGVEVGEDCVLHANVAVREGCRLGRRVILHPGVVIGADGFGYARGEQGQMKVPQVGIVEIGDDVEIGANTTVDRATLGKTVIGRGTKIDNLVQIAHNVVVGEHSIIAAQAGVAGSTRVGSGVVLAGQVGVVDHVEIGDRATIGPQSGVARAVAPGALLSSGLEAQPHREWLKVMVLLPRLPRLWNEVRRLEQKLSELVGKGSKGVKGHARRKSGL